MARGSIYYITTNKDDQVRHFNEEMFYDRLDLYGIDYVQDVDETESVHSLQWMRDMFRQMGAGTFDGEDVKSRHFAFSFCFHDMENARKYYFGPKLEKLKKEVAELDLFKVVKSAPCLDMILNDTCDDMVVLMNKGSEDTLTFDNLIRQLEPDTTYYVFERTVLMH